MQKILICLQRDETDQVKWNEAIAALLNQHIDSFERCGYAIRDDDVAPAHLLEMLNTGHPCDALLSLWVEHPYALNNFFKQLSNLGEFQAYGVMESAPLIIDAKPGRVAGMCQVAFIRKPAKQVRADWEACWLGDHTQIAIDTQSTFGYRQNVVATRLPFGSSPSWPLMDAIVEENFPAIAMTNRQAFFAADGNNELFEERQQAMMQSCFRFIDFEAFDCVPLSQYLIKI